MFVLGPLIDPTTTVRTTRKVGIVETSGAVLIKQHSGSGNNTNCPIRTIFQENLNYVLMQRYEMNCIQLWIQTFFLIYLSFQTFLWFIFFSN
jgi:hypothetical protein